MTVLQTLKLDVQGGIPPVLSLVSKLPSSALNLKLSFEISHIANWHDIAPLLDACSQHTPPVEIKPSPFGAKNLLAGTFFEHLAHAVPSNIPFFGKLLYHAIFFESKYANHSFIDLVKTNASLVRKFMNTLCFRDKFTYDQLAVEMFCSFPTVVRFIPFERELFVSRRSGTQIFLKVSQLSRLLRFLLCLKRIGLSARGNLPLEVVAENVLPFFLLEIVG